MDFFITNYPQDFSHTIQHQIISSCYRVKTQVVPGVIRWLVWSVMIVDPYLDLSWFVESDASLTDEQRPEDIVEGMQGRESDC